MRTIKVHYRSLCKAENDGVRQIRSAPINYSSLISVTIDAYRHIKPIETYITLHRMVREHLHILGMIDLVKVARIIHLVGGQSIRIAE